MVKTVNEDGFEREVPPHLDGNVHRIVYGFAGWTDELSSDTIDLLLSKGIIEFVSGRAYSSGRTEIYRSVKARI